MRTALVTILLMLTTSVAYANVSTAEALFREGKRLLDEGDLDAACPKLAESHAQDPSSGTLLNLALCHEKQGRLATAWAEYAGAARLASAQGKRDRAEIATKRSQELEAQLAKITIRAEKVVPGLRIQRGSDELGPATLGTPVPVDRGTYSITASANGYKSWSTLIDIEDGETRTVLIPILDPDPSSAPPPAPPAIEGAARPPAGERPAPSKDESSAKTVGFIVGGVGLVGLGIGTFFGVKSLGTYSDADDLCPSHVGCSDDARSKRDDANTQAWVSNVALGVGVLGLAAGAWLVLTAPKARGAQATTISFAPAGGGGAAFLSRAF